MHPQTNASGAKGERGNNMMAGVLTAAQWRELFGKEFFYGDYSYAGKHYFIDFLNPGEILVGFDEEDHIFKTVDEMMTAPIFDGHSLEEIAEQLLPI